MSFRQWLDHCFSQLFLNKETTVYFKQSIPSIRWFIWKERNNVILQKKQFDVANFLFLSYRLQQEIKDIDAAVGDQKILNMDKVAHVSIGWNTDDTLTFEKISSWCDCPQLIQSYNDNMGATLHFVERFEAELQEIRLSFDLGSQLKARRILIVNDALSVVNMCKLG